MTGKELTLVPVKDRIPATDPIDLSIDPSEGPQALIKKMHDVCTGYSRLTKFGDKVLFYVARLAVTIEALGGLEEKYGSLTQFVQAEIIERHGISSGSIWGQIGAIRAVPKLSVKQANVIGTTKLLAATRVVKKETMTESQVGRMLKDAESLTADEFAEKYPAARDGRRPGYKVLRIPASTKSSKIWNKYLGDRDPEDELMWLVAQHPERAAK